jgi:hypothetical protein
MTFDRLEIANGIPRPSAEQNCAIAENGLSAFAGGPERGGDT